MSSNGIQLSSLVRTPKSRWFHYKVVGGVSLLPTDNADEADISLMLRYQTKRDYRQMLTAAMTDTIERKAVKKNGLKALMTDDEAAHRAICSRLVLDWKLTVRGAFALEFEGNLSGQDPTATIEYNRENLQTMVSHSGLAARVHDIASKHENWFDLADEENEEKNSESGPNGSSDDSPAETASPGISTPTSSPPE